MKRIDIIECIEESLKVARAYREKGEYKKGLEILIAFDSVLSKRLRASINEDA